MWATGLFGQAQGKHLGTVVQAERMWSIARALDFERAAVWQLCAKLRSFPCDCCTHKSRHDFRKDQMTESVWKLTLLAFSVRFSFEIKKVTVPTIKMS
jgi:hypothetical protein